MTQFPTDLEVECPLCDAPNQLLLTSVRGLYDGYCTGCGEWFEFNYDEALASAEQERQMDAKRDERLER